MRTRVHKMLCPLGGLALALAVYAMPAAAADMTFFGTTDAASTVLYDSDADLSRLGRIGNNLTLYDGTNIYAPIDVAGEIDRYASGAYNSPVALAGGLSPYYFANIADIYGTVHVMLADGLKFSFGQAFSRWGNVSYPFGARAPYSAFARADGFSGATSSTVFTGLGWNLSPWGGLSLTASQTEAISAGLGNAEAADRKTLTTLGMAAHVGFGRGWITTLSYSQANAQLGLNPAVGDNVLHSQSYGIAVAKHGLFGHDALGLSLSRPSNGYSVLANDVRFQVYGHDKLFAGSMPETDIEVGYTTSLLDGGPLALQANASYQMNYNGRPIDSVTLLSRAKIKF